MSVSAVFVVSGSRRAVLLAGRIAIPLEGPHDERRFGDVEIETRDMPLELRRSRKAIARAYLAALVDRSEWRSVGDVPAPIAERLALSLRRVEEERATCSHWSDQHELRRRRAEPRAAAIVF